MINHPGLYSVWIAGADAHFSVVIPFARYYKRITGVFLQEEEVAHTAVWFRESVNDGIVLHQGNPATRYRTCPESCYQGKFQAISRYIISRQCNQRDHEKGNRSKFFDFIFHRIFLKWFYRYRIITFLFQGPSHHLSAHFLPSSSEIHPPELHRF